jgi:hypothetical protein
MLDEKLQKQILHLIYYFKVSITFLSTKNIAPLVSRILINVLK